MLCYMFSSGLDFFFYDDEWRKNLDRISSDFSRGGVELLFGWLVGWLA